MTTENVQTENQDKNPIAPQPSGVKGKWDSLKTETKKKILLGVVIGAVIVIGVTSNTIKKAPSDRGGSSKKSSKEDAPRKVSAEMNMLEKNVNNNFKKEIDDIKEQLNILINAVKSGNTAEGNGIDDDIVESSGKKGERGGRQVVGKNNKRGSPIFELLPGFNGKKSDTGIKKGQGEDPEQTPPPPPALFPPPPNQNQQKGLGIVSGPPPEKKVFKPQVEFIGSIDFIAATQQPQPQKTEDKKKEKRAITLPSGSFMEATLLTGMTAATAEFGKGNPEPALVRIKNIAVLPNDLKANLKGCFAIVEGSGRLDKERVGLRILRLSCLSKSGGAVIDQEVSGFVVDGDGMNEVAGKVVAKFGASVANAMLAGFLGGAGQAIKSSSGITTTGAGGATQLFEQSPTDIASRAIGGGVSAAADDARKFFLKIAEQTAPVIEILPGKNVFLVIKSEATLILKDMPADSIHGGLMNFFNEPEKSEIRN